MTRSGAAHECRRVLRENGSVVVCTGSRGRIDSYPYLRFFGAARAILERALPDRAQMRDMFASAGLHLRAAKAISQTLAPDWLWYAEKLEARGDSVLAQLTVEEFDEGLRRVRSHGAVHIGEPVVEVVDLFVFS